MNINEARTGQAAMCDEPIKQEKHLDLHCEINGMQGCIESLSYLLRKITNEHENKLSECEEKQQQPTLLLVLDQGPQALRETNSQIHDLINRIDQCLF